MADNEHSPRLAALRGLEASLESHQRAETARAAALASIPPDHEGAGSAPFRFRLLPIRLCLRSRRLRRWAIALTSVLLVTAGGLGLLWIRLGSGPISLDLATPWLVAAVEQNFGSRYRVEVGGTVLERDEHGRTAVRIRDVVLRDADGGVVASAPRAEVGFSGMSLLFGRARAERLNLVGAELSVRIQPDGGVTVFAANDTRPLAQTPALTAAKPSTRSSDGAEADSADRVDGAAASAAEQIAALLGWLDSLGAFGLDGRDLIEVGLKSANLTVDDQRNRQQSKFEKINLSLTRPRAGEVQLSLGSEDPQRPWTLLAAVRPSGEGRRAVSVDARNIWLRDLMLASRVGDLPVEANLPISASLRAELAPDGMPQFAGGRVLLGPGTVVDTLNPGASVTIDQAEFNLEWDAVERALSLPFQIVAGGNRLTLVARGQAPREPGAAWSLGLSGGTIVLAPSGRRGEPLLLNRIVVRGSFDPASHKLEFKGDISGKDIGIAGSGTLEFGGGDVKIVTGLAGRNMTATSFKQVWPAFINPPVRRWVVEHLLGGSIDRLEIATNAPLSTLRDGGPPVPDDGLSIRVDSRNTAIRPLDDLPAIREADMSTQIVGRNVTITIGKGVVDLPSGRRMTISNGTFEIPDTQVKKPASRVRMRIEGPVPAAAELLAGERLSEASGAPLDPGSSRGTVAAQITLAMPIDPDMPKGAVTYNVTADVANFAVDKFVMSQRIEAQALRVTATPQGYVAKGDVRIGGVPASVEYRRAGGDSEAEVRLQAVFDDAARARFGLNLRGALSGPVPIRLGGRIPATPDQDSRFAVEADLTPARIDNLLPGWVKSPSRSAKAAFTLSTRAGRSMRIDDIAVEGASAGAKGSVELDADGDLINANFPVFGLSDGDKASLKAERSAEGILKVTMRGDVYDGRAFVKSVLGGAAGDKKNSAGFADLDVDLKLGAVAGFNGEALRGLELKLSRRAGQIKALTLNARHGIDAPLTGDLRGRGGRQVIYLESNDAGALFRFTDTYPRMVGGRMWVAMDPPTLDQAPQQGLLNIRDFAVRGEAALDRVAGGAPNNPRGGVEFTRMRVDFTRAPGRLMIRDGVVQGIQVGATIDGLIDYAGNDVRLRGTFVPLYGLNNAFGQIPIFGALLGGPKEGLFGITYEVVGPPGAPTLRVNPISAAAPGVTRKVFEFPSGRPEERLPELPR